MSNYKFTSEKTMKKIFIISGIALFFASCSGSDEHNQVSIENHTAAGFDVAKLANVVKKSTDPDKLEKAINDPSNHITNLDLDNDGNVDYLKVTEAANNKLNVMDDVNSSQSVNVATINITPNQANNMANLNIDANPDYGGNVYQYHSSFTFTDFLIMSYFLRPHPYYVPIYHYGYYPHYYTRTRVITSRPTGFTSRSNPVYRATPAYRSSLSNPNRSQRSFSSRSSGSPVRSGGFGSSSSSRRSSFGSSSGSSSRSSFGRSRSSSFGRRR
jgi:hypothetical protein